MGLRCFCEIVLWVASMMWGWVVCGDWEMAQRVDTGLALGVRFLGGHAVSGGCIRSSRAIRRLGAAAPCCCEKEGSMDKLIPL